jgi:hypothetical protein
MKITLAGRPIHTRSLTIVLSQREDGRLRALGQVIDLRKTGFVPMFDELATAGIIHQMSLDALVDPRSRELEALEVAQPAVAVEPSRVTKGESCRDPAGNLQALVGLRFDAELPRELSRVFGGPRGCSHLLTLFHLVASALPGALDFEEELRAAHTARRPGEKLFRRSVFVDGHQADDGELHLAVQLSDFHDAPLDSVADRLDMLARQTEVQVLASVDLSSVALRELHVTQRKRTRETLAEAEWRDRSELVAELIGRPIMPGLGSELRRRLGGREEVRPLLDALLQLAPGFVQCTPALADGTLSRSATSAAAGSASGGMPEFLALGGAADSCYMWRRDGPLLQIRLGPG